MYETALTKLKRYWAAGDKRAALKLAASWGRRGLGDGAHAEAITLAWSATTNPEFYEEIGKDPAKLVADGYAAVASRYGLEVEEIA